MNEGDATWTLGVLIWLPVLTLLTISIFALGRLVRAISLAKREEGDTYEKEDGNILKWIARAIYCALARVGDRLTLACKRTWQYAGEDGYDCKYIRNQSPIDETSP